MHHSQLVAKRCLVQLEKNLGSSQTIYGKTLIKSNFISNSESTSEQRKTHPYMELDEEMVNRTTKAWT